VFIFFRIHHHYQSLAQKLSLENYSQARRITRNRVILALSGVHKGSLNALAFARTLSHDITAVHVAVDDNEAARIRAKWETYGDGIRMVTLESPYRLLVEPLLAYIEQLRRVMGPNETLTIVVPQFVSTSRWTNLLHSQTAFTLRMALLFTPRVVIIEVPYQV
jgi:hypothetical protein